MPGDDFVGVVSGFVVFDEVMTDRVISTVARRDSSTCQRAVGTLLSWPDIRSRAADSHSHYVTIVSGSQCLRLGMRCALVALRYITSQFSKWPK